MAALNPGQFKGPLYHGTTYDLEGKDIIPSHRRGPDGSSWGAFEHHGQRSDKHAFATSNEDTAWRFATASGMMARGAALRGDRPDYQSAGVDPGRVRVHTVAPHPLMQPGVHNAAHRNYDPKVTEDLQEYVAPAFRSTGTIDIKPGHQGTFSDLNWNQFRHPGASYHVDLNHPDDPEPRRMPARFIPGHGIADQMDLFTGRTSEDHAENDESALGDYHRNNLFGRL